MDVQPETGWSKDNSGRWIPPGGLGPHNHAEFSALATRAVLLESRATTLESRATTLESRATALETFTTQHNGIWTPSTAFPTPTADGQLFFETDTDKLWVWRSGIAAWVELARSGAWTTYIPTLTQSATVAKTNTHSRWTRSGVTIEGNAFLSVTGSGTAANAVLIGLPVAAAAPTYTVIGVGNIYTGSMYKGIAVLNSPSSVWLWAANTTTDDVLGSTVFTGGLANGNVVKISFKYEAAASV